MPVRPPPRPATRPSLRPASGAAAHPATGARPADAARRRTAAGALLALAVSAVGVLPLDARAQASFPVPGKTVRIIVPFPAGGQTDVQARLMATKLQPALGVPVVVENRPGAATFLGTVEMLKAPPDGHTLLYTISVTAAQNPHLYSKLPYDPRDLTPIMFAARSNVVLTVPANSPFNSVRDLVNFAKANPDKLNYASYSMGSASHLVAEMLQQATGTKMNHVPFKGSADAGIALAGGQVDFLFDGPTGAINYAKAGKAKMLAYADPKPYAYTVQHKLPNMAESGYPGIDFTGGLQFFGPKGMAPEVVAKLNTALAGVLRTPEMEKLFVEGGAEVVASTPAEHAASVKEQSERWGGVIRRLNLKLD